MRKIPVQAIRRFTLADQTIAKDQIFEMAANQFDDHGPNGTGFVTRYSPPAAVKAKANAPASKAKDKSA